MSVVAECQCEEQTHSVGAPSIAKGPQMIFRTKCLSEVIFAVISPEPSLFAHMK